MTYKTIISSNNSNSSNSFHCQQHQHHQQQQKQNHQQHRHHHHHHQNGSPPPPPPLASLSSSSKFLLSGIYFILAITNGWALKHHNGGQYSLAAFALLFVHSVLSILRYTHPNAGHVQRIISEQSTRYVPLLFISLIITQLLYILGECDRLWWFGCMLIYGIKIVMAIVCHGRAINFQQQYANACVLWNTVYLAKIAYWHDDCYWTSGLALLVLLNYFVLWRLTLNFSISNLEVSTVGLCFSVLFAMNTVDEIQEIYEITNLYRRQ